MMGRILKCRNVGAKGLLAALLVAVLLLPLALPVSAQAAPKGPWLDKIFYFGIPSDEETIAKIQTGEAHMRWWGLRTPEAVEKARAGGVKILETPSGSYDLFLNPVPFKEGFNPFAIREIREAIHFLIDRQFVANEIFKGLAIPRSTLYRTVSPDYVRNVVFMKSLEARYSYDFEKAKRIIFEAMGAAGATFEEGRWVFQGQPVVIKFSIRVEDLRRQLGDYVASQLEKVGFTVERMYQRGAVAFGIVYGGDPASGAWNIYTEGWAHTGIAAYDDTDAEYYDASPGTEAVHAVYKPSPLLVDVATRLSRGEYADLTERARLIQSAAQLHMQDAVRIWVVDQLEAFPYSKDLAPGVYDLYGGPYGWTFGRSMRLEGKVGGEAKIGSRVVFVSAYNPTPGGFTWLFDGLVANQLFDPGVFVHPHTGRGMPVRTDFKVQTGGVSVPPDALTWSWAKNRWVPVGEGITAKSKVTYTATFGKWHHGAPIGKEDVMMTIWQFLGYATPGSPIYDPGSITPGLATFVSTFKGIKWLSDNTYEVYIDYWHPDETFIAAQADVFPGFSYGSGATPGAPWELYSMIDALYEDRTAAFSEETAAELGVPQIDLTKGETLPLLEKVLATLAGQNFVHPAVKDFVTDPSQRWKAMKAFHDTYGHFMVSAGPFFIERVDVAAEQVILRAFRDYPFNADKWDFLLKPRVPSIEVKAPDEVVPGLPATIEVTTNVEGKPYKDVTVQYVLEDPTGVVVASETVAATGLGKFSIELGKELTSKLTAGIHRLTVIGVGAEAALAAVRVVPLNVIPQLEFLLRETSGRQERLEAEITKRLEGVQSGLAEAVKGVAGGIDKLSESVDRLNTALSDVKSAVTTVGQSVTGVEDRVDRLSAQLPDISRLSIIAIGIAVVAIIIGVALPVVVLRGRRPA